eukprot:TRINITY_DN14635_c0_g1_i1.p2 TRINITY_DN14635_c0_g1~~TRINITY_DN14635_c0_g1_i1.p2  ORF type:complete len:123 (-),score=6.45 TRINITY_DN14635_c0_g1_i1:59-427(-)
MDGWLVDVSRRLGRVGERRSGEFRYLPSFQRSSSACFFFFFFSLSLTLYTCHVLTAPLLSHSPTSQYSTGGFGGRGRGAAGGGGRTTWPGATSPTTTLALEESAGHWYSLYDQPLKRHLPQV